jgi:hypothetical protein
VDSALLQIIAREWLGLTLTESEASSLVKPLDGLRRLVETMEEVPLSYTADPFTSPGSGDHWLETWPEK